MYLRSALRIPTQSDHTNLLTFHLPPARPVGPEAEKTPPFLHPFLPNPGIQTSQVCPPLAGIFLVLLLVHPTGLAGASVTLYGTPRSPSDE